MIGAQENNTKQGWVWLERHSAKPLQSQNLQGCNPVRDRGGAIMSQVFKSFDVLLEDWLMIYHRQQNRYSPKLALGKSFLNNSYSFGRAQD